MVILGGWFMALFYPHVFRNPVMMDDRIFFLNPMRRDLPGDMGRCLS